jgi:hypothetical protein
MNRSELLTKVWIWLSLTGYGVGAITFHLSRGRRKWDTLARLAYTFGFITLIIHVAFALHLYHQWSQDSVYRETARQTAEVFGLNWGGGMYVNYAFMLGWMIDAIWWWRGHDDYRRRPKWLAAAWQTFLLFIIFNATFVFASGIVRWLGLGLCLTLCFLWWFTARSQSLHQPIKQTGIN